MRYPIVIHKDKDSDFGVTVPDLPGCFSAGSTLDDAMAMTRKAILGHIEVLISTGQPVPEGRPIDEHRANPDFADAAYWALVDVDLADLPGHNRRINISMNERVLDVIDQFAHEAGESRSGLLQAAAVRYVSQSSDSWKQKIKRKPQPQRRKSSQPR